MTDPLTQRIADEEAKLRLLEAEVQSRRKRIDALKAAVQAFQQGDNELDAMLAGKIVAARPVEEQPAPVQAAPAASQATLTPQASWPFPTAAMPDASTRSGEPRRQIHRRGEVKTALLAVLTLQPKHLGQIMSEAAKEGYDLTYDRIRTQLWSYKAEGLVDNPEKGCYVLTAKGKAYVDGLKGESAGGAALSGATTSADDLV